MNNTKKEKSSIEMWAKGWREIDLSEYERRRQMDVDRKAAEKEGI